MHAAGDAGHAGFSESEGVATATGPTSLPPFNPASSKAARGASKLYWTSLCTCKGQRYVCEHACTWIFNHGIKLYLPRGTRGEQLFFFNTRVVNNSNLAEAKRKKELYLNKKPSLPPMPPKISLRCQTYQVKNDSNGATHRIKALAKCGNNKGHARPTFYLHSSLPAGTSRGPPRKICKRIHTTYSSSPLRPPSFKHMKLWTPHAPPLLNKVFSLWMPPLCQSTFHSWCVYRSEKKAEHARNHSSRKKP